MDLIINKQELKGNINVISSKSIAHRAIISAFISEGTSSVDNLNLCDDVYNTLNIIRELTDVKLEENRALIKGFDRKIKKTTFIIDESMSTFNFLFPILSFYSDQELTFILGNRLKERIKDEYKNLYIEEMDKYYIEEDNKIIVKGFPLEKALSISNVRTSQCISGVLFLLSTLNKDFKITLDSSNSLSYIDMTINVLKEFGKNVYREENNIFVMHNQIMQKQEFFIKNDGSYYLMLKALHSNNNKLSISYNDFDETDSDFKLAKEFEEKDFILEDKVDLKDNPDAIFSLALLALNKTSPTTFVNISRLRCKESDRVKSLACSLNSFGIKTEEKENEITIFPGIIKEATVECFNDHRLAMFDVALAIKNGGIVRGVESLSKSAPYFIEDLEKAGFKYNESVVRLSETLEDKKTTILFKENLLDNISGFDDGSKYVIVADKALPKEYIEKLKLSFKNSTLYITKGVSEEVKSVSEYERLCEFLLENNISKTDYLIGAGGGSITDLVGYTASTYKRGIKLILVPTTILSMADASIGFKNALDVGNTKNAIGNFYAPEYIFIDPKTIDTLSDKDIKCGLAEIIKIFALRSPKYFYQVFDSNSKEKLNEWILEAIKLKLEFVNKDPYDKGIRHALNFGHTYGHAFELKENIGHGEAIAKGMRVMTNSKELVECLNKYGYSSVSDKEINDAKSMITNDKKVENNKIKAVYLEEIGKYIIKEYEI